MNHHRSLITTKDFCVNDHSRNLSHATTNNHYSTLQQPPLTSNFSGYITSRNTGKNDTERIKRYYNFYIDVLLIFLNNRLIFSDNSSINSQKRGIISNNISRATPVVPPRRETAHSYQDTDFSHHEENNFLSYQTGK